MDQSVAFIHRLVVALIEVSYLGTRHEPGLGLRAPGFEAQQARSLVAAGGVLLEEILPLSSASFFRICNGVSSVVGAVFASLRAFRAFQAVLAPRATPNANMLVTSENPRMSS